jgi:chromosome partitioning protein
MSVVVLLSSPKGGVGKSSLSRNILASAAQAGKRVVGIDLDQQSTLKTWAERRERARVAIPGLPLIPVFAAPLSGWREALKKAQAENPDLIVIDTPPSVEQNTPAIASLSDVATIVLVPCQPMQDDVDSTAPWMRKLLSANARGIFVLNRANRRTKSYSTIQTKLLAVGPLCPLEIPHLEEIHFAAGKGLGVADLSKATSRETFDGLWSFVARETGL